MNKYIYLFGIGALFTFIVVSAQAQTLKARITDKQTAQPIVAASISIYHNGRISGIISNNDGAFNIHIPANPDSIKVSAVGYNSQIIPVSGYSDSIIKLERSRVVLPGVIVKPIGALEIIQKAIEATHKLLPAGNFENHFFYREIIKDTSDYFSVAEAIFKSQYFPSGKDYKLKMEKGRCKEDVAYTRLFEDYHPGGGPEELISKSLSIDFPDFLDAKKIKWFVYHKDSVISYDDRNVYIISFDQKPTVHEALDKGKIYVDAEDFSIIKYESQNSPLGINYAKGLTGTDKLFASLLHIDFKRKGWVKNANFSKMDGYFILNNAYAAYQIAYKQPGKNLDLNLTITTEMAVIDGPASFTESISKGEEWKRKNLVANLPSDFDTGFWGSYNIVSPTSALNNVIASIGKKNNDMPAEQISDEWQYFKKDFFVAYKSADSITLIPIMKGSWEDDETAGMLYQPVAGDFVIETKINITKRSNKKESPDNGFQQAGIILRDSKSPEENNITLCIGTGGNSSAKYFLRKTQNGKSKGPTDKIKGMNGWLRFEKKGTTVTCSIKNTDSNDWKIITSYNLEWLDKPVQAGILVMARFAGSGPKMKPDMSAVFTNFNIKNK